MAKIAGTASPGDQIQGHYGLVFAVAGWSMLPDRPQHPKFRTTVRQC
jgi:hypothetical protein